MGFSEPLGRFYAAIGMDTSEFRRELERSQRALKKAFGPDALRISEDLTKMVAGLTAGFVALGAASVKMAADQERVNAKFSVLLGSMEKAKRLVQELEEIGKVNPIPMASLEEAAGTLSTFKVAAKDIAPTLRMLGDVAAVTKIPLQELSELYGRGFSKGEVSFKEINTLAKQGIPLIDALAKNLRVARSEIKELAGDGKISAEDLRRAFETMTTGSGQFAGGMAAMGKTVHGQVQIIQNNLEEAAESWGRELTENNQIKEFFTEATNMARKFADDVEKSGAKEAVRSIFSDNTRLAIYAIAGAISGAMVPALISMTMAAFKASAALLVLAPYAAVGAAVIGFGTHLVELQNETKKWEDYTRDQTKALENMEGVGRSAFSGIGAAAMESELFMMDSLETLESAIKRIQQTRLSVTNMPRGEPGAAAFNAGYDAAGMVDSEIQSLQDKVQRRKLLEAKLDRMRNRDAFEIWSDRSLGKANRISMQLLGVASGMSGGKKATPTADTPIAEAAGPSNKGAEKALTEAKRLSESIRREWEKVTLTEREQINLWYQEESQALEASKTANTSYLTDKQRLYEIYRNKLNDIDLESAKSRKKYEENLENEEKKRAEKRASLDESKRKQEQEQKDRETQIAEWLETFRTGQALEKQLADDYRRGDLANYIAHLNAKQAAFAANLQGQQEYMQMYRSLQEEAHRSELSYMTEGYQALYSGLTNAITGILTGTQNAAQAVKNLGLQMVEMVIRWMVQRKLAALLSSTMEKATAAQSVASASVVSSAWAKAAAMVSLATMGANMAPAMASLSSMTAFAQAMAIPGLANGGIVTRPTIAMIGEGKGPEAVIPLDRLGSLTPKVTVNVVNNSGAPIDAKPQVTMNMQEMIVSVVIDAHNRNVGGLRSALKGG